MDKTRFPSPALVVALAALFVSLSGTAVAAGIVPLAKRSLTADSAKKALIADNAKKLDGQTAESIAAGAAQQPGPASSAAGLITVKATQWSLAPGSNNDFVVMCDAGQKAVSGGQDDPNGWAHSWDSRPTGDGAGWRTFISLTSDAPSQQSGTVFAICLR